MSEGWIKIHRCLQDNPLWSGEPFSRGQAWVDLILVANHKESSIRTRRGVLCVARGQVGRSLAGLAGRWHWSVGKVDRFLVELEKAKQIKREKEGAGVVTLITILKYEEFQADPVDTPPKDKDLERDRMEFFEQLWQGYPRKEGKKAALTHYKASVKSYESMELIGAALTAYINKLEREKTEARFIQQGSRWFNNWQDYIPQGGQ